MRRGFTLQKQLIISCLSALLLVDVALGVYAWNLSSAQSAQQELATLQRNEKLLKADIEYAQKTRQDIPRIQKDCDDYEHSMFPGSAGYSSVTSDLGAIAAKSGLRLDTTTFRSGDVKGHALKEIDIDASVSGTYAGVVHFLNGLQRSSNLYAVESLSARSDSQNLGARGLLRVSVHLKTYFRAA
jgi:type IV pilus assembly protein PilO